MIQIHLTDYTNEIDGLIQAVDEKINSNLTSKINSDIKKELEIKLDVIEELLSTIEKRLKRCEEIYLMHFKNLDHSALNGISPSSSKELKYEIYDIAGKRKYQLCSVIYLITKS